MINSLIIGVGIFLVILIITAIIVGAYLSVPRHKGPISKNFDGSKFYNAIPERRAFWQLIVWLTSRKPAQWPQQIKNKYYESPAQRANGSTFRVTFIGHATFLIQINGLNILTDPILSERCGPFSLGPKRRRAPGLTIEALPKIDVILVSHNHYDHMDIPTIKTIFMRDKPIVITPLGNAKFLMKKGIPSRDLDWWESITISSTKFWVTPARHFSARGIFDYNNALWSSFMIESNKVNVYFAGDTGFGPHIEEIAKRFNNIEIALLPIGCHLPIWFMGKVHITPEEAVKVAQLLKAKYALGMHFGVFPLADDGAEEPVQELKTVLQDLEKPINFDILDIGEWKNFNFSDSE